MGLGDGVQTLSRERAVEARRRQPAEGIAPETLLRIAGGAVAPGVRAVDFHAVHRADVARSDQTAANLLWVVPVFVRWAVVVLRNIDETVQFRVVERRGVLAIEEVVRVPHLGTLHQRAGIGSLLLDGRRPILAPFWRFVGLVVHAVEHVTVVERDGQHFFHLLVLVLQDDVVVLQCGHGTEEGALPETGVRVDLLLQPRFLGGVVDVVPGIVGIVLPRRAGEVEAVPHLKLRDNVAGCC